MADQRQTIVDPPAWVSAVEAARLLDVRRATLYAYVSRGVLRSRARPGTRVREYAREDLVRLKARHDARTGHGAVAAGALRWGEPVLDSSITEIREDGPWYRGHAVGQLAAQGHRFESIAELLWTGVLATAGPWPGESAGPPWRKLATLATANTRPLEAVMLVASIACTVVDTRASRPAADARAWLRWLAVAPALARGAEEVARASSRRWLAEVVLMALGGRPSTKATALVDAALVCAADHELNPSTFAARVAASAGAGVPGALLAALATFSGPAHGAASDRVHVLLEEVGRPERAVSVLRAWIDRGDDLPGFGHPLYAAGDPRAKVLLERARAYDPKRMAVLDACIDAASLAGVAPPNVDLGLLAVARVLRLPPGSASSIFAVGRTAGWIAHALEQQEAGFILRPRARFVAAPRNG